MREEDKYLLQVLTLLPSPKMQRRHHERPAPTAVPTGVFLPHHGPAVLHGTALFIGGRGTETARNGERNAGFRVRRPEFQPYCSYFTAPGPEAHPVQTSASPPVKWAFNPPPPPQPIHEDEVRYTYCRNLSGAGFISTWQPPSLEGADLGPRGSQRPSAQSASEVLAPGSTCRWTCQRDTVPLRGVAGTLAGLCGIAEVCKLCGKIRERRLGCSACFTQSRSGFSKERVHRQLPAVQKGPILQHRHAWGGGLWGSIRRLQLVTQRGILKHTALELHQKNGEVTRPAAQHELSPAFRPTREMGGCLPRHLKRKSLFFIFSHRGHARLRGEVSRSASAPWWCL